MSDPAEDSREPASADPPAEPPLPKRPSGGRLRRVGGWLRRNAYLALVVGAGLMLSRVVEFEPPERVRIDPGDAAALIGEAQAQEFSREMSNPQTVQMRATLRQYPNAEVLVGAPDPDVDRYGRILSQPVVTTILGMSATVEQTVHLDDGVVEVDIKIEGTPRLTGRARKGKPPELVLEHDIEVVSRSRAWYQSDATHRTHVGSHGTLTDIEGRSHRIVFDVMGHLFALDLELHRAL